MAQTIPSSEDVTKPPVLKMTGITKSFPGVRALDGASLSVLPGEVHGLMGENGAGKSTLLKILAGAQKGDAGEISLDGKPISVDTPLQAMTLGINIIYQELMLVPHLSVAENIFLGREPRLLPGWINGRLMRRQARALMDELGLAVDVRVPVGGLPLAQRQMVEIAKATSRQSKIIAMDEPSATLTEHELEHLFTLIAQLKAQGIGIIYISHRMEEVFQICDRVTVMRDGKTVGTSRVGETSREDLLRRMVGRDLDETFPKSTIPPGKPLLRSAGAQPTRRSAGYQLHGPCRRSGRAGGPGRCGPDRDRPVLVWRGPTHIRRDPGGRATVHAALPPRSDPGRDRVCD